MKNGTICKYSENYLECNCLTRPLNRWLRAQLEVPAEWLDVKCYGPGNLENQPLHNLTEEVLACPEKYRGSHDEKYEIGSDLQFREFQSSSDKITMKWLVDSKQDIGEFYVFIRDKAGTTTVFEKFLPYNERKTTIKMKELNEYVKNFKVEVKSDQGGKLIGGYEICLVAVDSNGELREWRKQQCRDLPRLDISRGDLKINCLLLLIVLLIFGYVMK